MHQFGDTLQVNQNQLAQARLELKTTWPSNALTGQVFHLTASPSIYDGVPLAGHAGLAIVDAAASAEQFRFIPGSNQAEYIVGKWTFCPSQSGATTVGRLTLPPAPGSPQGLETFSPFWVGGQSALPTGYELTPDADAAGDYAQPSSGPKRYTPNWVRNLNTDLIDGYHASLAVAGYTVAVRTPSGHLRVPLDPTAADHATSKQYVDNNRGGIRVRTAVAYRTLTPLPAHTYNAGTQTLTATVNGALSVDGVVPSVGDRIMVAEQADATTNWIMTVVATGSAGAPWSLRRVYTPSNADPDNLGDYQYGDYFAVNGGSTLAGSTWVMSGSPTGGGGQAGPGDEVYFNLFQISQPIKEGRGITLNQARVHFWKEAYSGAELNCIPYLKADINGVGALGVIGLFGASGTYALKGTAGNFPLGSSDSGAVFANSSLQQASTGDGTAIQPTTDSGLILGSSTRFFAKTFTRFEAITAAPTAVVAISGTNAHLGRRLWSDFMDDIRASLPWGSFVPTARTVTLRSSSNHLEFATVEAGPFASLLTQDLSANRTFWVNLPQLLHTGASPTFAGLSLTALNTASTKPASVYCRVSGSDVVQTRTWASFVTDIGSDLSFSFGAPTTPVGIGSASAGVATSALRSDAKLVLDQSIAPTWTGLHTFNAGVTLGPGTTSLAPIRFNGSTNLLVSTPAAGMLETDLAGSNLPRGRLYFTDWVPVRHPIAFQDDCTFTNDGTVQAGAGVAFYGVSGTLNFLTSTLDGQVIGTGDFAVWVRFKLPTSLTAQAGLYALTNQTGGGGGGAHDHYAVINTNQTLTFTIRDASGVAASGANWTSPSLAAFAGRIIDVIFTRSAGTVKFYVNGVDLTTTPTNGSFASASIVNGSGTCRFHVGGTATTVAPAQTPFYRAAVFNRNLSQADVLEVCRSGISELDQWGSTVPYYESAFSSSSSGWVNDTGGTIGGISGGYLNITFANGYAQVGRGGSLPLHKYARITYTAAITSGTPFTLRVANLPAQADAVTLALSSSDQTVSGISIATLSTSLAIRVGGTTSGGATFRVKDLTVVQLGALVDLDLSVGQGSIVPDRSGRYHGTLNGSNFYHTLPRLGGSGDGTYFGVRKVVKTIAAKDNDSIDVTHSLGTTALQVQVWNANNQRIDVGVVRKTGSESSIVTLTFGLFGAPSVTQNLMVVITG